MTHPIRTFAALVLGLSVLGPLLAATGPLRVTYYYLPG